MVTAWSGPPDAVSRIRHTDRVSQAFRRSLQRQMLNEIFWAYANKASKYSLKMITANAGYTGRIVERWLYLEIIR